MMNTDQELEELEDLYCVCDPSDRVEISDGDAWVCTDCECIVVGTARS